MAIPLDRREFLKLGLLAASAQLAPLRSWSFTPQALPHATSPKKVLVVGAGLAGLVAGYELTEAGHDVIILEAQLRPGGRVLTLREPFADGLYAEAGAARIPDNHDLTLHYVQHFGLTLVPFFPTKLAMVCLIGGKRIKYRSWTDLDLSQVPLNLTAEERRLGMSGLLRKYLGDALKEIGDPRAPGWPIGSAKAYDNTTIPEFLKERGASHGAIELLEYPYASAEDDPVSLLWNLRDTWFAERETTRYKIQGGNDLLPKAFAEKLKEKIHYGSPVVRIEQDSSRVRAIVVRPEAHLTIEADRLICAVPFPPLRRVEVLRLFPRKESHRGSGCNGFGSSDLPQEIFHPTFDQPGTRGLLASYVDGRRATSRSDGSGLTHCVRFPGNGEGTPRTAREFGGMRLKSLAGRPLGGRRRLQSFARSTNYVVRRN